MLWLAPALLCVAIDGDTLRCGDERIRLSGIDAPEMPGHCRPGRQCVRGDPERSRAALQSLVTGKRITVRKLHKDRYGRTIAVAWAGGMNLSCAQIRSGNAIYVAKWDNGRYIQNGCNGL